LILQNRIIENGTWKNSPKELGKTSQRLKVGGGGIRKTRLGLGKEEGNKKIEGWEFWT